MLEQNMNQFKFTISYFLVFDLFKFYAISLWFLDDSFALNAMNEKKNGNSKIPLESHRNKSMQKKIKNV